jgi:hypothetical protein
MSNQTSQLASGQWTNKKSGLVVSIAIVALFAAGCGDAYEPVDWSECSKLVGHAGKLLALELTPTRIRWRNAKSPDPRPTSLLETQEESLPYSANT